MAARLDGVWVKRDGFLKDVISGRRVNNRDRYVIRGQMLFQPSDDLSVRLIADYSRLNEECCAAVFLPAHNFVAGAGETPSSIAAIERALGAVINDDPYKREISITPGRSYRSDVHDGGVSAEINYDFGGAQLTSITAYRTNKFVGGLDADFNNLDIFYRADDGGCHKFKTFTQELRLQGTTMDGRLDWLVGGFYANEELTRRRYLSFGADSRSLFSARWCARRAVLAGFPGYNLLNPFVQGLVLDQLTTNPSRGGAVRRLSDGHQCACEPGREHSASGVTTHDQFTQKGNNYAIFTHNIFKVTDQLSMTLGGRYTIDKKSLERRPHSTVSARLSRAISLACGLAAAAAADPPVRRP